MHANPFTPEDLDAIDHALYLWGRPTADQLRLKVRNLLGAINPPLPSETEAEREAQKERRELAAKLDAMLIRRQADEAYRRR